jgi:hypothetical protein
MAENEDMATADRARKDTEAKLDAIMDHMTKIHSRLDSYDEERAARKDAEERERMDRSRYDAARKDRFGPRQDGERFDAWKKRHDADESGMAAELAKGGKDSKDCAMDARRARMDAEAEERMNDAESFDKWAKEEAAEPEHKKDARKDGDDEAEEKEVAKTEGEEKEIVDREDSRKDSADMKALRAKLERMAATVAKLTAEVPAGERDLLAAAQNRADGVAAMFGERAVVPTPGETALAYRKRLAGKLQGRTERFKNLRFDTMDEEAFSPIEDMVYNDAIAAARNPKEPAKGILVPIVTRENGREVTRFSGDIDAWMQFFKSPGQPGSFINPHSGRGM